MHFRAMAYGIVSITTFKNGQHSSNLVQWSLGIAMWYTKIEVLLDYVFSLKTKNLEINKNDNLRVDFCRCRPIGFLGAGDIRPKYHLIFPNFFI